MWGSLSEHSRQWHKVIRFMKYCTTGLLNTAISYVVYAGLTMIHVPHASALAMGYIAGMITSYLINARWTFQRSARSTAQLCKFIAMNLIVLGLSELSLRWILAHVTTSAYVGQVMNLVPMTILGFLANQWIVFRSKSPLDGHGASKQRQAMQIFWIAILLVSLQRILLLISDIAISRRRHLPVTLHRLFVLGYKHWDAGWYIRIARHGYTHFKETAFWPLYPWLIRAVHSFSGLNLMLSGVLISVICFVITLQCFGLLVNAAWDFRTAVGAMVLYAFCPTAYYFDAVYTESLFMALLLAATYTAHTGRFRLASILAALAALTRNTGILILIVLVAERVRLQEAGWRFWTKAWWQKVGWSSLWIAVPPLTLFGYCLWLRSKFGSLFPFIAAERLWHRTYMPPWATFTGELKQVFSPRLPAISSQYALLETSAFVLVVVLLVTGLFMLKNSITRYSWWLYSAAVTWITTSEPSLNIPDYLVSFPRYVLMIFPVFVYLARLLRTWWATAIVVIAFAMLLYTLNGRFFIGRWIA
ncbi:MAG: GtrA family protein [Alicyclobacillus sp.]|nr:GtrA family protein [Alicyclobacillus sp.]